MGFTHDLVEKAIFFISLRSGLSKKVKLYIEDVLDYLVYDHEKGYGHLYQER